MIKRATEAFVIKKQNDRKDALANAVRRKPRPVKDAEM